MDKKAYYGALKSVQSKTYKTAKTADLTSWLDYFTEGFLSSVEILIIELKALAVIQNNLTRRLSKDESDIISYAAEFGSINISEAQEILPDVSKRTAQRILGKLVSEKYLATEGDGPSTRYIIHPAKP